LSASRLANKHSAAIRAKVGNETVLHVVEAHASRTRGGTPGDDWYGLGKGVVIVTSGRLMLVTSKAFGRPDFWPIQWSKKPTVRVDYEFVSVLSDRECLRFLLDSPEAAEELGAAIDDARSATA